MLIRQKMRGENVARERAALRSCSIPPGVPARVEAILDVDHPEVATVPALVDEPHAACVALAFLDHLLRQRPEKSVDVRFTHEQIERELHDFSLHLRSALRTAAIARFAQQG